MIKTVLPPGASNATFGSVAVELEPMHTYPDLTNFQKSAIA